MATSNSNYFSAKNGLCTPAANIGGSVCIYGGGLSATVTTGSIRYNTSSNNIVVSAYGTGTVYLGYDCGSGGVIFSNGSQGVAGSMSNTGVFTACSSVTTPVSCGTTCVTSPCVYATGSVYTPIVSGSTCLTSPCVYASGSVYTPIVSGSTCVTSPIVCGATCVTAGVVCGTTCVTTPAITVTGGCNAVSLTSTTSSGGGSVLSLGRACSSCQVYQTFVSDTLYFGVPSSATSATLGSATGVLNLTAGGYVNTASLTCGCFCSCACVMGPIHCGTSYMAAPCFCGVATGVQCNAYTSTGTYPVAWFSGNYGYATTNICICPSSCTLYSAGCLYSPVVCGTSYLAAPSISTTCVCAGGCVVVCGGACNPTSCTTGFSVITCGAYGGGFLLVDGTYDWGIWDNGGTLNFGSGTSLGALSSRMTLSTSGLIYTAGQICAGGMICSGSCIYGPCIYSTGGICGATCVTSPYVAMTCGNASCFCSSAWIYAAGMICSGSCIYGPCVYSTGSICAAGYLCAGCCIYAGAYSCAGTCMISPIICGITSVCSPAVCGTSCVTSPYIYAGCIVRCNARGAGGNYPVGHYTSGETVFELDPTWSNAELQTFFGTTGVSWVCDSTAPGGSVFSVTGAVSVGNNSYSSGFPYIPIESDDIFYMEAWIKDVTCTNTHYMGSIDFDGGFSNLGGNPGSYGYWTMANQGPGTTWTRFAGYVSGFGTSGYGTFKTGAKYFSPQALFNYSGGGTSYVSGWKITRVNQRGKRAIFPQSPTIASCVSSYGLTIMGPSTACCVVDTSSTCTPGADLGFGTDCSYAYIQSFNSKPLLINNLGNAVCVNALLASCAWVYGAAGVCSSGMICSASCLTSPTLCVAGGSGAFFNNVNVCGCCCVFAGGCICAAGNICSAGLIIASQSGFQSATYSSGRNRMWSFGNADSYGISYFQGSGGYASSVDMIGMHFGTASVAGSCFTFVQDGRLFVSNNVCSGGCFITPYQVCSSGMVCSASCLYTAGYVCGSTYLSAPCAYVGCICTCSGGIIAQTYLCSLTGNTCSACCVLSVGMICSGNCVQSSYVCGASYFSNGDGWFCFNDTDRNPNDATYYPCSQTRAVRWQFSGASYTSTGGNYSGVLHFHPWAGTTSSTGDASYQMAFGSAAANASGVPQLRIRNGIDSTWNAWYNILTSAEPMVACAICTSSCLQTGGCMYAAGIICGASLVAAQGWLYSASGVCTGGMICTSGSCVIAQYMYPQNWGCAASGWCTGGYMCASGCVQSATALSTSGCVLSSGYMCAASSIQAAGGLFGGTCLVVCGNGCFQGCGQINCGLAVNCSGSCTSGAGLSLYSNNTLFPQYGIMFQGQGTLGTLGPVSADWATYFTMDCTAGRGWVFKATNGANCTAGNVFSIGNNGIICATNLISGAAWVYGASGVCTSGYMYSAGCICSACCLMAPYICAGNYIYAASYMYTGTVYATNCLCVCGASVLLSSLAVGGTISFPTSGACLCGGCFNASGYFYGCIIYGCATSGTSVCACANIVALANITAYSDIRLKENIQVIENALEKVKQIRGITYTRNDREDKDERYSGIIAQEVEKVLPEVVHEDHNGIKHVAYGNMVGLLIEAIKEQQSQISKLEELIKSR